MPAAGFRSQMCWVDCLAKRHGCGARSMTRHRSPIPARRRRLVSLTAVLALLVNALMPLATAGSAAAGTLLAAICSPNGIRYVEIDLAPAAPDAPRPPDLGTLDHCPGCLGGGAPAMLPVVAAMSPRRPDQAVIPVSPDQPARLPAYARFKPRAPPRAS